MNPHSVTNGMMACIGRILRSSDPYSIELAIEAVEQINDEIALETHTEPADVRRLIRDGVGCFGDVQNKCLKMGVV